MSHHSIMSHPSNPSIPSSPRRNSNPFVTPALSKAPTQEKGEYSGYFPSVQLSSLGPRRRKFVSARLKPGELDEKPWLLGKADPNFKRKRWEKIIFWSFIALGIIIGAGICVWEYINVSTGTFCLVFEDDFHGINKDVWKYELQTGGFGTGSFDWTTDDPKNAYTDAEGLHIVPTLTVDTTDITLDEIYNGYVVNLTKDGTCTSDDYTMCSIRSNKTSGAIVPPVRSARLTTQGKKTMKYGRVEVVAKMPQGDWLWPAIWMMPDASAYGPWPMSGEIDIAESRGNAPQDYPDGRNSIGSTLHWGPLPGFDAFWRTTGKHNMKRGDYSEEFHTYGLEWTENYMFMYIDSRLLQVFFLKFSSGPPNMWERGKFGTMITKNDTALYDPWAGTDDRNAPFDKEFFLILNVAVGGTNGYWQDEVGNKPWADGSPMAPKEFWEARQVWLDTWGEGDKRGMTVQSVKMYSQC